MKLFELFDIEPRKTRRTMQQHQDRTWFNTDSEKVGSGSFASVFSNKSDKRLSQVIKIGKAGRIGGRDIIPVKNAQEDAYLSYLEMIHVSGIQNPFFPKIYDLKVYQDPEGNIFYRVVMEKLTKSLGTVDLDQLSHRYFREGSELANLDFPVAIMIAAEARHYRTDIIDDYLLQALDLIEDRVVALGYHWDLGSANMMVRITGHGPQVVFTDPVA